MRPRAFAFALLLASSSLASAQESRTARLDWDGGIEGCMSAERFGDEVAARVGRIVFTDDSSLTVHVGVGEEEGEVAVRVELRGTRSTEQTQSTRVGVRTFRDASCDDALETAAAVVAVWIDEGASGTARMFGTDGDEETSSVLEGGSVSEAPPRGIGGLGIGSLDGRIRIRASSNEEGLTLHIETNTGRGQIGARYFQRLCVLPCETRIRPGVQQFGIARGNGIADPLSELTELREDSELFLNLRPASPWNLAGRWLIAASLLIVAPVSLSLTGVKRDEWGNGPFIASIAVSAGLLIGGLVMLSVSDDGGIEAEVRPLGAR